MSLKCVVHYCEACVPREWFMNITLYVVLLYGLYAKKFINMVIYSDNLCDPEHNFRN
jgi:hypothetical protein